MPVFAYYHEGTDWYELTDLVGGREQLTTLRRDYTKTVECWWN